MNEDQLRQELRKELSGDSRLGNMLKEYAKYYADQVLRKTYDTVDAATLIRQSGMAEGIEKFIKDTTTDASVE